MNVSGYFYVAPDKLSDDGKYMEIDGLDKSKYMSDVFYRRYKDYIHKNINPTGRVAFLYVGGASEHHSHSRNYGCVPSATMPVFSQMGYMSSKIAKRFKGVEYVSINSNACASSMFALHESERLLQEYDSVIIYGEEWTEPAERLLFSSLNIDIVCSDGFFVMCLDNKEDGIAKITNTHWKWNPDRSPFDVSVDGYTKVLKPLANIDYDVIKMHGTGTMANDHAEHTAISNVFGKDANRISIKEEIGHTQGVSTGVELCKMIDEKNYNKVIAVASGLGSFYGSCYMEI